MQKKTQAVSSGARKISRLEESARTQSEPSTSGHHQSITRRTISKDYLGVESSTQTPSRNMYDEEDINMRDFLGVETSTQTPSGNIYDEDISMQGERIGIPEHVPRRRTRSVKQTILLLIAFSAIFYVTYIYY